MSEELRPLAGQELLIARAVFSRLWVSLFTGYMIPPHAIADLSKLSVHQISVDYTGAYYMTLPVQAGLGAGTLRIGYTADSKEVVWFHLQANVRGLNLGRLKVGNLDTCLKAYFGDSFTINRKASIGTFRNPQSGMLQVLAELNYPNSPVVIDLQPLADHSVELTIDLILSKIQLEN